MVLWEAVLSPALQILFDKLASGEILDFLRRCNLNDLLLEKLKIAYLSNAAVLDDAEKKQYDDPAIEAWLDMLKAAIYEAEDTLDELATEALRCKLQHNSSNQVKNWNLLASNFDPFGEGINSRIQSLIDKLEYIAKQKDFLGLKLISGEKGRKREILTVPTTPLINESSVHGRNFEKEEVMKLLIGPETNFTIPSVISVVGMGGIGKTTLAQLVYNDKRVDENFDVKAWAYVSDDFNLMHIIKSLLESTNAKPCDTMNFELLQNALKEMFNKRKFLVVLDDVWNEKLEDWDELLVPLMVGNPGSKVIITTRNIEVVSITNECSRFHLNEMSDEACWSLFTHRAFGVEDPDMHSDLVPIGRKIMEKCKGLPLAVKTLGSVLSSKRDIGYWNSILHSSFWEIPPKKNAIIPSLRLSYHHLPSNLKRCFAYCSIFPRGFVFDKKSLVLLWMAEGFVQPTANMTLEEVGEECFSELLLRSFFQEAVQDKSRYIMHDLLNDLAQSVSRKMCIFLEGNREKDNHMNFEVVCHFSCFHTKYDVYRNFEVLNDAKWLRTFLPLASPVGGEVCYLSKKVSCHLIPRMKCLRVLCLNGYCISELPESIGNLKHLRYIDLSYTEIKNLPQSLCSLLNLQTLLLCNCNYLTELPSEIGKLVNLRYLDVSGSNIKVMPLGIGDLVNLHSLPHFTIGNYDSDIEFDKRMERTPGSSVGDLRNLSYLQNSLSIFGLENVECSWDARRANLQEKRGLDQLVIEWSANSVELLDENVVTEVLEMLQPNSKLEVLKIRNYPGKRFPTWTGDPVFMNLVTLTLSGCRRCEFLPPAGQLSSLKYLFIEGMLGVKSVGDEFWGYSHSAEHVYFASLESLSFKEMLEWEEWSFSRFDVDVEVFPKLLELRLEQCPKLQGGLPYMISSLSKIVIFGCQQLSSPFPKLPKLHEMELKECDIMLLLTRIPETNLLKSLEIEKMRNLTHVPDGFLEHLKKLERMVLNECVELVYLSRSKSGLMHLISLHHLTIRNCSSMICMCEEFPQQVPENLEYLELDCCHNLDTIPSELQNTATLQELVIRDCPKLESLSRNIFPKNLKGLVLRGCGLESLPEYTINNISSLEYLYISGCLVLTSFPRDYLLVPTTFKQLTIDHCPNLEFLPQGMMHIGNIFLELLEIFDCPSITSFPGGKLPKTLKTLTIWNCFNLESVADIITESMSLESLRIGNCTNLKHLPSGLHTLINLYYLEVDGCPCIEFFPEEGLPSSKLKKLHIFDCENLKFLVKCMQKLTSLQELRLANCPLITSSPEDGMPVNLISLDVKDCENMKPISEWGLHRLNSLKKLRIQGSCRNIDTFPEWLLPSTLETLHIIKLPNLMSLSPWLKNLTSLEDLKIKECHKINSLPNEGFPPLVSCLEINDCPLLQQACEKDWSSIDHIPCIIM